MSYRTLREYREQVLKLPQHEIARIAGCKQGWVSSVERGHLPRPWNRKQLVAAYRLPDEKAFIRLVKNANKTPEERDLSVPMVERYPLFVVMGLAGEVIQMPLASDAQAKVGGA